MSNQDFTICYIGRPSYQKNVQFLIEIVRCAVVKIPNIKFYLLGVGYYSPELSAVQALIKEYSLENHIQLIDWLPQEEIFKYVSQADIYLSTSLYEGLPLSVIEVMSLGKPIIATDVVGNRDCVFDGENGYLMPFDKDMFVDKIVELYQNQELREKMGVRSYELFLEHFCVDTQIDKLKQIYENIANKKQ